MLLASAPQVDWPSTVVRLNLLMTNVLAAFLDQRTSIELPQLLLAQVVFRTINPTIGFLNVVFLGTGLSMFVLVASFFWVGVVKFNATGLEIRLRIERSMAQSVWLDNKNGNHIQALVLQNYLFFGNATSIFNYIATMFEEVDETQSERLDFFLPPMPRVLVLDGHFDGGYIFGYQRTIQKQ